MTGMIDIHSHILPGLDDGSSDMRESIHMLRLAAKQGITQVVSSSGRQRLTLKADSTYKFKNVNGFIYYDGGRETQGSVLISDIHLTRRHD